MRKIMILNPAAGRGDAARLTPTAKEIPSYTTACVGDAERYTAEQCALDPETQFIVCGGDGTVNEVVNGIMKAGAADKAAFSIVPTGTGNDFIKNSLPKHERHRVDIIRCNDRYAVNMINIGFDSNVVEKTQLYKEKHRGSTAYLMGVANVLMHKLGENFAITYTDADGNLNYVEKPCLLCAVANGPYCGGGFHFAPLSSLQDGLLDVLIVNKVTRTKFISLVSDFRRGEFISPDGTLKKRFVGVLDYIKCRSINIDNLRSICVDGEVTPAQSANITVLPSAVTYIS